MIPTGGGWPRGWDEHRAAQVGLGLRLTPAERLRWLEETMAVMRRWVGRASRDPIRPAPEAAERVGSHRAHPASTGRGSDPSDEER